VIDYFRAVVYQTSPQTQRNSRVKRVPSWRLSYWLRQYEFHFIDPGAEIEIKIERLGALRCRFAEPTGKLLPSRWPLREPLKKYHA
jgi:hypothetical protein